MPEKIIKTTPPENDPVKHPNHYCYGRFECVEVIQELTAGASGPEGFLLGNVIKYLWRYRRKNGVEDLRKARRYIDMLIRLYEDPAPCEKGLAGQDDGTSPGIVFIRDNRPVFSETTTWAAARLTGQNGEFFDGAGNRRAKGMLVKVENGLPSPYIARILLKGPGPDGIPRYVTIPYKYFSPLAPEPENGRPVFNRAVAEGAARYIGKEGEFFDELTRYAKRSPGRLGSINPDSPAPFTGLVCIGKDKYITMPYRFFSPLPETGADEKEQEKPEA